MVCDSNVDLWRRAAFFEESGETYKRVIAVCLRPVEDLTSKLADGLEGSSVDKSDQISHQLRSPTDTRSDAKLHQAFNDSQVNNDDFQLKFSHYLDFIPYIIGAFCLL